MRFGPDQSRRRADRQRARVSPRLKATPPVVISLTSHPARYAYLHKTLRRLVRIDYPALTIDVFLPKRPPGRVERIAARDPRLTITLVDRDFGPATKYLYALDKYPDRLIAVCDDDHTYSSRWLHTLVSWHLELGGEACVACTGMVELQTIDPTDPHLAEALQPIGGTTREGIEVYQKVRGERLRGRPVPILWPQGYSGYLLPPALSSRIAGRRHYEECLELLPADQLRDMEGRVNDDTTIGAYLHRLGRHTLVVPHDNDPSPLNQLTRIESHGALQQRFRARYGMNMGVAMFLALRKRGWL